ncbi:hypothetical protein [Actinoplanes sp. NPDC048796]|uniref:hypothetical protein n=1 Tax=unclassified Actinoplanes TaxID=2626549 RepID=UPI0033DC6CD6
MKFRPTAVVPLVLASALALTACGSKDDTASGTKPAAPVSAAPAASSAPAASALDALTGEQILKKAQAALKSAKSYHVAGTMVDEGEKISLDLKIAGTDTVGFLQMKGGKIELLSVGKQKFFRPNPGFWTQQLGNDGKAVAKLVGTRWVKIDPSDKDTAAMFEITNMAETLTADGPVKKTTTKVIDGKKAQGLTDSVDGSNGTLYVATEGEPYPLRLEGPKPADGSLNFTEFGKTFTEIKAPAAADVFDMKSMGK